MSNDTAVSLAVPAQVSDPLTELLRSGARRLIEVAVSAEFEEYLSGFVQEQLPDGRQRVVRNGHLPERRILTGLGEVDVRVPKARSRSGSPEPFRSSVVPPYVRRCASLDAAIPWLYLHGVSTGQMRQAVAALVGEQGARGLSANVVSRLKRSWDEEYRQWCRRRLDDDWVYLWVDGIYSGLRGERERLCVLVVIGVNTRGDPRRGRPVPAFSDVPPVKRISRARPIPPGPADKDNRAASPPAPYQRAVTLRPISSSGSRSSFAGSRRVASSETSNFTRSLRASASRQPTL